MSYEVSYYCKLCPPREHWFTAKIRYGGLRSAGAGFEALDAEEAEHMRIVHPEHPYPTPEEQEAERDAYSLEHSRVDMESEAKLPAAMREKIARWRNATGT